MSPSPTPPPTQPFQLRVPLGLAAELLRAGCVATSSEIALALVSWGFSVSSPSLTFPYQEGREATAAERTRAFAVMLVLGILGVLACAFAGAAVSCVGGSVGGKGGEEGRRGRLERTPSSCATNAAAPRTEAGRSRTGTSSAANLAAGREAGEGRREGESQQATAAAAWLVPSGALGGIFYALTSGGVFGGVMREYLLGERFFFWFE